MLLLLCTFYLHIQLIYYQPLGCKKYPLQINYIFFTALRAYNISYIIVKIKKNYTKIFSVQFSSEFCIRSTNDVQYILCI
jgi:hypothetical protein